jgi:hypothetical protein
MNPAINKNPGATKPYPVKTNKETFYYLAIMTAD